jgi:hypothetical protein
MREIRVKTEPTEYITPTNCSLVKLIKKLEFTKAGMAEVNAKMKPNIYSIKRDDFLMTNESGFI